MIGIDEAGRGPLIGPMVVAAVKININQESKLIELGVKDSKLISPKKRIFLFEKLKKIINFSFFIISPNEIDSYVKKNQLNYLEAKYISMNIIKLNPMNEVIYIDCPSPNKKKYEIIIKNYLQKFSTSNSILTNKLILEHKADTKYIVVGAASIIAKVIRDREIQKIKKQINYDFGSGYPSDPKTIFFIKHYWQNKYLQKISSQYIRKSWSSYSKHKTETQKKLTNY